MSRRTLVVMTDDIDGQDADETVRFALDGIEYEIDLRHANANKLRAAMEPFVGAARKLGKSTVSRRQVPIPTGRRQDSWLGSKLAHSQTYSPEAKRERQECRDWAFGHGVVIPSRGRIANDVWEAFKSKDPTKLPGYKAPKPTKAAKVAAAKSNGNKPVNQRVTKAVPAAAFSSTSSS